MPIDAEIMASGFAVKLVIGGQFGAGPVGGAEITAECLPPLRVLIYRKAILPWLRYADFGSMRAMTKEDCRANALKCYRIAQKAADRDVRRTLLDLAVQWRDLAAQIERLQWENAPEPASPGGRPTLH